MGGEIERSHSSATHRLCAADQRGATGRIIDGVVCVYIWGGGGVTAHAVCSSCYAIKPREGSERRCHTSSSTFSTFSSVSSSKSVAADATHIPMRTRKVRSHATTNEAALATCGIAQSLPRTVHGAHAVPYAAVAAPVARLEEQQTMCDVRCDAVHRRAAHAAAAQAALWGCRRCCARRSARQLDISRQKATTYLNISLINRIGHYFEALRYAVTTFCAGWRQWGTPPMRTPVRCGDPCTATLIRTADRGLPRLHDE